MELQRVGFLRFYGQDVDGKGGMVKALPQVWENFKILPGHLKSAGWLPAPGLHP